MAIFAWTALALLLPTAAMYVLIVALRGSRGLAAIGFAPVDMSSGGKTLRFAMP